MGRKRVNFFTDFKGTGGAKAIEVYGDDGPGNSRRISGREADRRDGWHDRVIHVRLMDANGNPVERKPFADEENVKRDYFIKFNNGTDFKGTLTATRHGWEIRQKTCDSTMEPLLIANLPPKLNILPVKLLAYPLDLILKVVRCPWDFLKFAYKTMALYVFATDPDPENTNITVGDEEE